MVHCDLQLCVPLAADVGNMVKCESEVVADLRRAEPLRHGSPPCDGKECAEQQRNKKLQVAMLPIFDAMIKIILEQLAPVIVTAAKIRLVLDDSPTKRYSRKVEGAGYHHNPTPGPAKKGRGRPKTYGERIAMKAMVEDKKG